MSQDSPKDFVHRYDFLFYKDATFQTCSKHAIHGHDGRARSPQLTDMLPLASSNSSGLPPPRQDPSEGGSHKEACSEQPLSGPKPP
jgi:hypothetical protein